VSPRSYEGLLPGCPGATPSFLVLHPPAWAASSSLLALLSRTLKGLRGFVGGQGAGGSTGFFLSLLKIWSISVLASRQRGKALFFRSLKNKKWRKFGIFSNFLVLGKMVLL
jgi:hypothetical protein